MSKKPPKRIEITMPPLPPLPPESQEEIDRILTPRFPGPDGELLDQARKLRGVELSPEWKQWMDERSSPSDGPPLPPPQFLDGAAPPTANPNGNLPQASEEETLRRMWLKKKLLGNRMRGY